MNQKNNFSISVDAERNLEFVRVTGNASLNVMQWLGRSEKAQAEVADHLYTNGGFVDTFRAAHLPINLLYPVIGGALGWPHAYDESGWLPAWSSPGHLECMIGMGQYAHDKDPVHHMIYLYDYIGQPWKAQLRLRQTMALLYQATPDGNCGEEDTGQMSLWYVFSGFGIYPACPGDPLYLISSPLFNQAALTLPNQKTFTITARNNGPQHHYIQSANLNGQSFDRTFISHQTIVNGSEFIFQMDAAPNYQWGGAPESRRASQLQTLFKSGTKQSSPTRQNLSKN